MFVDKVKTMLALSLFATGYAMADTTSVCTLGGEERVVSVVSSNPGAQVPCEVKYQKGGETQVLWNYQNETGQCELHSSEMVSKLQGWGWTCAEQAATAASESGEPAAN